MSFYSATHLLPSLISASDLSAATLSHMSHTAFGVPLTPIPRYLWGRHMWMVSRPLQSTGAVRNSPASSATRPFVRPARVGPARVSAPPKNPPSFLHLFPSVGAPPPPSLRPSAPCARTQPQACERRAACCLLLPPLLRRTSASVGGVFDEFRPEKLITRMGNLLEASPL